MLPREVEVAVDQVIAHQDPLTDPQHTGHLLQHTNQLQLIDQLALQALKQQQELTQEPQSADQMDHHFMECHTMDTTDHMVAMCSLWEPHIMITITCTTMTDMLLTELPNQPTQ